MILKKTGILLLALVSSFCITNGQTTTGDLGQKLTGADKNASRPILTALPFMTIAPDSRAGAMGDAGVATSPDINSQHWNAAKYAFIHGEGGIAISYTPWLKKLVNDINLAYLSGFYRIDDQQVISASLRYFSLGDIILRNEFGDYQGNRKPSEFAIDAGYSRLFSENFSGALVFRFIRSDIMGGGASDGTEYNAAIAFAADISAYYQKDIKIDDKDAQMAFGLNISNLGNKVSYTSDQDKQFIPTNLRLGGRLSMKLDEYNSLGVTVDFNKLLVPTPPVIKTDSNGVSYIAGGYDNNVSLTKGIIQSFYDAPGGFSEEMHEITYSIGTEYWYREQFAIRAGYFNESQSKGNRKYFTVGFGFKLNVLGLDFAYLIPSSGRNNPLANTMRFSLNFQFDKFRNLR